MKKKNTNSYIVLLICFILVMVFTLIYFMYENENIDIKNNASNLLKDLYNIDSGKYSMKDGIIYSGEYKMGIKSHLKASGDIQIDKYHNVRFNLKYQNKCISKTYEGNIKLKNAACGIFKDIKVSINRNNNKISFISNRKGLDYKISTKDDYSGIWVHEDYNDNIVLKSYNEGTNYIWFKDSEGNISEAVTFEVDCLYTTRTVYDSNVFYCSGSTVRLDDIDYVVIKDSADRIKLMKFKGLDQEMPMCDKVESNNCFYTNILKNTYNWDNSYIKNYLNDRFYNNLSDNVKEKLLKESVCVDLDSKCNNELCIGYTKDEILYHDYECNKYSDSFVRLISYDEFNYVYSKAKNKNVLNGYYYGMNSYSIDKGSSIQYNLDYYVYEDLTKPLNVKPVLVLKK